MAKYFPTHFWLVYEPKAHLVRVIAIIVARSNFPKNLIEKRFFYIFEPSIDFNSTCKFA